MILEHQLLRKLQQLLISRDEPHEECEVVCFMIQLRKIADYYALFKKQEKFDVVRFYCDWVAHPIKDRVPQRMKNYMASFLEELKTKYESQPTSAEDASKFASFELLRGEITNFLNEVHVPANWITDDASWEKFIKLLSEVLAEQPMIFKRPLDVGAPDGLKLHSILFKTASNIRGISFEAQLKGPDITWTYTHYLDVGRRL